MYICQKRIYKVIVFNKKGGPHVSFRTYWKKKKKKKKSGKKIWFDKRQNEDAFSILFSELLFCILLIQNERVRSAALVYTVEDVDTKWNLRLCILWKNISVYCLVENNLVGNENYLSNVVVWRLLTFLYSYCLLVVIWKYIVYVHVHNFRCFRLCTHFFPAIMRAQNTDYF